MHEQIEHNYEEVSLVENVTEATITPKVLLNGSGNAQLQGRLTISTASPTSNMNIATLPSHLIPFADGWFPVAVLRSGAIVSNAVKVNHGGFTISGVTITSSGSSYITIPTLSVSGNGDGASLVARMKALVLNVGTQQAGLGSYAPGDTFTLAGGTSTTAVGGTVQTTQTVSATVASGGSGGTDGTQTVTGTTGTGTKFQASVTVAGGAITAVLSITVPGSYTVNPTLLTAEPVTGASLTGATLNIKMGVLTATVTTPGSYTALPSDPVSIASTSGSGTGATFSVFWGVLSVIVLSGGNGYDEDSELVVTGGSGTGAAGTLNFGDSTAGVINLVTEPEQDDIINLDSVQFFVDSYS